MSKSGISAKWGIGIVSITAMMVLLLISGTFFSESPSFQQNPDRSDSLSGSTNYRDENNSGELKNEIPESAVVSYDSKGTSQGTHQGIDSGTGQGIGSGAGQETGLGAGQGTSPGTGLGTGQDGISKTIISVPEFPTVAMPIISIIAITLLLHKRKG